MTRIVQKYGGSSVASPRHVRRVAQRVVDTCQAGHQVVVVVSAMGGSTNELLSLVGEVSVDPPRRELDLLLASGEQVSCSLLAMAIEALGQPAVALTGPQGGVRTEGPHGSAEISRVDPARIELELAHGRVVVVAGFQGQASDGELTTLGRGGSDTTAVALAAALEADRCQILSDVDGVYTADPRVVPGARRLEHISHAEMLELARHGARVLNEKAVDLAARTAVTIEAGASFDEKPGTLVEPVPRSSGEAGADEHRPRGIANHSEVLRVRASQPGRHGALGSEIEEALDPMAILHVDRGAPERPFELVACTSDEPEPAQRMDALRKEFGDSVEATTDVGAVTVVGLTLGRRPVLAARTHRALSGTGIDVDGLHSRDHSVTCLVPASRLEAATRTLHAELVEVWGALGAAAS